MSVWRIASWPWPRSRFLEEIVQPADEVLAVAREGLAQDFWVGDEEVRRCDRVGELLGIELHLGERLRVEPFDMADRILHPVRGEEVGLLDEVEDSALLPIGVLEALVAAGRRNDRVDIVAEQALGGVLPEIEIALHELPLRLDDRAGVREEVAEEFEEGGPDIQRVDRAGFLALGLRFQELGDELLALRGDLQHVAREGAEIGHGVVLAVRPRARRLRGLFGSLCRARIRSGVMGRRLGVRGLGTAFDHQRLRKRRIGARLG